MDHYGCRISLRPRPSGRRAAISPAPGGWRANPRDDWSSPTPGGRSNGNIGNQRGGRGQQRGTPMSPLPSTNGTLLPQYLTQDNRPRLLPMARMRVMTAPAPPMAPVTANLNHRITYYDIQLAPVPQLPHRMAVLDNDKPETVNRLLELWHAAVHSERGILQRYHQVKGHHYYSANSGPLTLRQRKEMVTAAALICLQYGRGIGRIANNTESSCALFVGETPVYERMTVMACTIVHRFPIPQRQGLLDPLTFDEIMNCDLYLGIRDLLRRLKTNGIVSENGEGVKAGTSILDGVFLPTFLFFDALLDDRMFRSHCQVSKLWVDEHGRNSELDEIHSNPRIVGNLL